MADILLTTIILIITIVILGYLYLTRNFSYWKKRNVNGPTPSVIYGTYPNRLLQKRNFIYDINDIYNKYKKNENFVGGIVDGQPELLVLSPATAHEIYVTKFKYFHDNLFADMINPKVDKIVANNPFFIKGESWKEKRGEITPALTISRIKASYPVMLKVCEKMTEYIKSKVRSKNATFEGKELATRYTAEVVTDCIYGLEAGAFNENIKSEILENARNIMNNSYTFFIYFIIASFFPFITKFVTFPFLNHNVATFFTGLMKEAIALRSKTKSDRSDFLNYLIQLKEKKNLTTLEITSHTMSFFMDGYETSAILISHSLLLIARDKKIQQKLRDEIEKNLDDDGVLSFDKLNDMSYLENCLYETLRLFSPLFYGQKLCTEAVELENTNGRKLLLNVGDKVTIPFYSFHYDKEYYPNPEEFDPDRYKEENGGMKKFKDMGVFLPFGDGPRICLGMKFGLSQTKAAICAILRNFEITTNEKTRKDNYNDPKAFLAMLDGGIWIDFKELKN